MLSGCQGEAKMLKLTWLAGLLIAAFAATYLTFSASEFEPYRDLFNGGFA